MALVGAFVSLVMIATAGAPAASAAECPNETIRIEQGSTYLPECRAYEMVSPNDQPPYLEQPDGNPHNTMAALSGERIGFFSWYPAPGFQGSGFYFMSTRTASGWTTEGVSPRTSTNTGCNPLIYYSPELNVGVITDGHKSDGPEQNLESGNGEANEYCSGVNEPSLVEDEPQGFQNLFVRDNESLAYTLVDLTPKGVTPADAWLEDASGDFSRIYFEEAAKLTPEAPAGEDLYESVDGAVHLVTILPSGAPVNGRLVYASGEGREFHGAAPYRHAVSSDGKRVFFEAEGKLYLRENPEEEPSRLGASGECLEAEKACTIQVDASQAGGAGGGGRFLAANAEGTRVFFTDEPEARLTTDTQAGSGPNLYEYEVATGKLTDLTPAAEAGILGISGLSEDGSYLYFVAEGALAASAAAGQPNLYLVHEGRTLFIATLNTNEDRGDWAVEYSNADVAPNGKYLAFASVERLTGYDNTDVSTGRADSEVFLYSASAGALSCVSCDPSGAAPTGSARVNGAEPATESQDPGVMWRSVMNDGRVFFDSPDPLVAGDVNGLYDAYEYREGRLSLISSGTGNLPSFFYGAGASGRDVFLVTNQALVARDTDSSLSLYDARAGGGFPEPPSAPACSGEGCRGAQGEPAAFQAPGTIGYSGPGNLHAPPAAEHHTKHKKGLTRKQKLRRARKMCRRRDAHKRHKLATCLRRARRRYGAKAGRHHRRGAVK